MRTLKTIWHLTVKEWRSLFGDPMLVLMIVFVFSATIYSVAKGVSSDVKNATVAIIDADRSALSYQIRDAIQAPFFKPPLDIRREEVDKAMDAGDYIFVLDIPPNFQRDVLAGRSPDVQLLIDATTMTQAGVGASYLTQIFQRQISSFLQQQGAAAMMPVQPVINIEFNPNSLSEWYMPVMEVGNMITLLSLVLVGAAVIRERERGTIEHLLVMPVKSAEIVLAKIIANGLVVCTIALLSMHFMVGGLLQVPLLGSLTLFALGAGLFMFSIASLAVMLATLAPTMPQYSLLMMPVYIIALMFSGSSSPRSNMPETAQWISEYWPTTQFMTLAQNVLLRGAGFDVVWPQMVAMTISGALFLGFALFRFRRMLEQQG